ncbi:MAG: hypothetical protein RLZZ210_1114 [Pseudomonadota bacterium]|jgi:hypothetical protein
MKNLLLINQNFIQSEEFNYESFVGTLHWKWIWDKDKYFKLELAIYELHKEGIYDGEVYFKVFRIYSFICDCIIFHLDKKDKFKIKNISNKKIIDYYKSIYLVFDGYFNKQMPDPKILEIKNPYLTDDL